MINNHSKNNHNNKNSQINKNNIPGRPAKSNVAAHNEHSVDTRELALEMLIEINERGSFSHIVLRSVLDKYQYLSKQDRAFMTRLVDGTIEYMLQLDYIIDSFSKDKGKEDEALHQKPSSHERLPDKVHGRGAGFSCMQ